PAVEQAAEQARRVEPGYAQPVHRPVLGHQRAGVAVGQEGVVADGWKRRRLRRPRSRATRPHGHEIHGARQPPNPSASASAAAGPQVPSAYGWTGGGESSSGWKIRHFSSTSSCRTNLVLSPRIAASSRTSYAVGPSPGRVAFRVPPSGPGASARRASSVIRNPVTGSNLTTSWSGSGSRSCGKVSPSLGGRRNTTRSSVTVAGRCLPVRSRNGTPD